MEKKIKVLLIRFSSFGDVTQSLSLPTRLKELAPNTEVHWVTRSEFESLICTHPFVDKLWLLNKNQGLGGLFQLIKKLKAEKFDYIYDAHNNLRSNLISMFLRPPFCLDRMFSPPNFTQKSQNRWKRFLLFKFRINLFEMPFSGQKDLFVALKKWNLRTELPEPPQLLLKTEAIEKIETLLNQKNIKKFITLAPSSAHALKKWPAENFRKLIELNPQIHFLVLGGKEDTFISAMISGLDNALDLSGQFSFQESAACVFKSEGLICNDTGLLHIAEQLGKKAIALMGPAPFGFPSRASTLVLEKNLPCRPCSKHGQGPCTNSVFQECLRSFSAEHVQMHLKNYILN